MEEKIFTIPLRESFKKARIKRAAYSVRFVREFLINHTKVENIKLGRHLNEAIWQRGPGKPPRNLRVKAVIEKDLVKAELLGKEYEDFVAMKVAKKEKFIDKLKARMTPKEEKHAAEEAAAEGKAETVNKEKK